MEMKEKILLGALAAIGAATPAYAQSTGPSFAGTISGSVSTSTTAGTSTSATTGDSTTSPYVNTVTTTQNLTLNTTGTGSTGGTVTFNGNTFGYGINGTATGSQPQQIVSTLVQTFSPASGTTPPSVISSSTSVSGPTNSGTASISSISVSGSSGFALPTGTITYGGTLTTDSTTPDATGKVNVTENTIGVTTSGTTYTTYTGKASFAPGTGVITVGPMTQVAQTSVGSGGLTTTGSVNAATVNATNVNATNVSVTGGLNMNGNRITNVGTPVAATDAATKGYVDSQITAVNGSISSLASLVEANRKRSDAGIATAVALSGASFLPGKRINVTANIGAFRDEVAIAGQLGVLVSDNVALNAGVATSFHSYGGTSVRGGVTFGF